MKDETKMNEAMMDNAAADAMGSHGAADSAAYGASLETASAEEKRFDLEMRETVARMAGAAPYMKPSADLRGRVLQATAPATFKMDDYVKANRETNRFYKWGFYAAMAFLAAGAWYNVSLRNNMTAMQESAKTQFASIVNVLQSKNDIINKMASPDVKQIIAYTNNEGKPVGAAFVNAKDNVAVVVMGDGVLPPNYVPQLAGHENGKLVKLNTSYVIAAPGVFPNVGTPSGKEPAFALENIKPAESKKVYQANIWGN